MVCPGTFFHHPRQECQSLRQLPSFQAAVQGTVVTSGKLTIPAKGCGEKHSNLEHGKMVEVGARHPHWWHPLVPPWGGQWSVATGCQQFRRQWGHLGAGQGSHALQRVEDCAENGMPWAPRSLDSIQTTTAKSCKKCISQKPTAPRVVKRFGLTWVRSM